MITKEPVVLKKFGKDFHNLFPPKHRSLPVPKGQSPSLPELALLVFWLPSCGLINIDVRFANFDGRGKIASSHVHDERMSRSSKQPMDGNLYGSYHGSYQD